MNLTKNQELELRIEEIETDAKINLSVPEKLKSPHKLINDYLEYRKKLNRRGFPMDFSSVIRIAVENSSVDRAVRIYDTFLKACEVRGHHFYINNSETKVKIFEEEFELRFWEKSKTIYKKDPKWTYGTREYEPTGKLFIQVIRWGSSVEREWGDTSNVILEEKLARIIANLEVKSIIETKDRLIREKHAQERKEKQELEDQIKKQKDEDLTQFRNLITDTERWKKANDIRSYISFIEQNKEVYRRKFENLEDWIVWAKKRIDWYDPLVENNDELLGFFNESYRMKLEQKEQKRFHSFNPDW